MRRGAIARALPVVLLVSCLVASVGVGAARYVPSSPPTSGMGPAGVDLLAPASQQNSTPVDLLNGQQYVAPNLLYQGVYEGTNTSFPALLTGSTAATFWPSGDPILLLGPEVSDTYGHDDGLVLVPGAPSGAWDVNEVGAESPVFNGDSLTTYFLLSPTSTSSWNSEYYSIDVEGPYVTSPVCSGSMVFPYSTTPYVAVQWDPAYQVAYCGIGTVGDFNLYLVEPGPGGVVNQSSVTAIGPIGESTGPTPANDDYFDAQVSYSVADNTLRASVLDALDPSIRYSLSADLDSYGFQPKRGSVAPYSWVGVGAGGYDRTGWGLLYLAESSTPLLRYPVLSDTTLATLSVAHADLGEFVGIGVAVPVLVGVIAFGPGSRASGGKLRAR